MRRIYIVFAAAALFCLLAGCGRLAQDGGEIYNENKPCIGKTVVIDAGHGGDDPGASGFAGSVEAELNLAVAKKLETALRRAGAEVIMTRETPHGLYEGEGYTKKQRDMMNRGNIIRNSGADIAVSIHMNSFGDPKYSGTQVFYDALSPRGRMLAESIQAAVRTELQPDNRREAKTGDYFILKAGAMPSVIVECGFITNEAEEKKLNDEEYQERLAWCILLGIESYFIAG